MNIIPSTGSEPISAALFESERPAYLEKIKQNEAGVELVGALGRLGKITLPHAKEQQIALQTDRDRLERLYHVNIKEVVELDRAELRRLFTSCHADGQGIVTPAVWQTLAEQSHIVDGRVLIPEHSEEPLPEGIERYRLHRLSPQKVGGTIRVIRGTIALCGIIVLQRSEWGKMYPATVQLENPVPLPIESPWIDPGVQAELTSWWKRLRLQYLNDALSREGDQFRTFASIELPSFEAPEVEHDGGQCYSTQHLPFASGAQVPAPHLLDLKLSEIPRFIQLAEAGIRIEEARERERNG